MSRASGVRRVALGVALAGALTLPLVAGCHASDPPGDDADVGLIDRAMTIVGRDYIAPVDRSELTTNALKGMLANLDPHSEYMDEAAYQALRADLRGHFGGIGIRLAMVDGIPQVISPIDGTPAAHAGIDPGDVITEIDGSPTKKMGQEEIISRLRGPVGTTVVVMIARAGRPPFPVTLTRAVIDVASVKSRLEPAGIGYLRVLSFGTATPSETAKALDGLMHAAGGRLNGLVLDLRDDPGGAIDSAVAVAGDFLDGGTVVSTRGRSGEDQDVYRATRHGDRLPGTPMVVLINGASASGSEIVAGALQDRKRATVMGTRSFGKGSVQSIIPLRGHGAIRLTVARYYTPAGRSIQDVGITPDIVVTVPKAEQATGKLVREADLKRALGNTGSLTHDAIAPPGTSAAEGDEATIDPKLVGTAKDAQLHAALAFFADRAMQRTDIDTQPHKEP